MYKEDLNWLLSRGFERLEIEGWQLVVDRQWLEPIVGEFGKLVGTGCLKGGRGSRHCAVKISNIGPLFLKQYHHGGLLAQPGDTGYESPRRFLAELRANRELFDQTGQTPRPGGVFWRRTGDRFSGYFFSKYIESRPFSELLRGEYDGGEKMLKEAGRLLAKIHQVGVDPGDFHVGNLLVTGAGKLLAVDFDPVKFVTPARLVRALRIERFNRSLAKNGFVNERQQSFVAGYCELFDSRRMQLFRLFQKPFRGVKNSFSDFFYLAKRHSVRQIDREKILLRAPNWVGDAVMSLPVVQSLAGIDSRGRIDVVCRETVAAVYQSSPAVGKVWRLPEKTFGLPSAVSREEYSALVVLPKSWRTAIQGWKSGIPRRFGLATRGRGWFFTDRARLNRLHREIHHTRVFYHACGELLSEPGRLPLPRLELSAQYPPDKLTTRVEGDYMVIHCGSAYGPAKRWPVPGFRNFLRLLLDEYEFSVVGVGVAAERELTAQILQVVAPDKRCNLAGETTLQECMEIIAGSRLTVANDSGLMHLSAGLGSPTVGIFGSTSPELTSPLGEQTRIIYADVECSPCFKRVCPLPRQSYRCLKQITPEKVLRISRELLEFDPDEAENLNQL